MNPSPIAYFLKPGALVRTDGQRLLRYGRYGRYNGHGQVLIPMTMVSKRSVKKNKSKGKKLVKRSSKKSKH